MEEEEGKPIDIRNLALISPNDDLYEVTFYKTSISTFVTSNPSTVDRCISFTERVNPKIIGFHVQWYRHEAKRYDNRIALLELCVDTRCLIFKLLHSEIPPSLKMFLENPAYTFVGYGIKEHVKKLYRDHKLKVSKTVDVMKLAADAYPGLKIHNTKMEDLVMKVLKKDFKKPDALVNSRWDNGWLVPEQVTYACLDAYFNFKIGQNLMFGNST